MLTMKTLLFLLPLACGIEGDEIQQVPEPLQADVECPHLFGLFPRRNGGCDTFIQCQEGIPHVQKCPHGLFFNPRKTVCDWPANVPSCHSKEIKGFFCPILIPIYDDVTEEVDFPIRFRYKESCRQYVECRNRTARLFSCDSGLSFDEETETCIASNLVTNCV